MFYTHNGAKPAQWARPTDVCPEARKVDENIAKVMSVLEKMDVVLFERTLVFADDAARAREAQHNSGEHEILLVERSRLLDRGSPPFRPHRECPQVPVFSAAAAITFRYSTLGAPTLPFSDHSPTARYPTKNFSRSACPPVGAEKAWKEAWVNCAGPGDSAAATEGQGEGQKPAGLR